MVQGKPPTPTSAEPVYLKPMSLEAVWVTNTVLLSNRKKKLILNWAYYEAFQRNLQR